MCVDITILDDDLVENDEDFTLTLQLSILQPLRRGISPNNNIRLSTAETTVTIFDNDGELKYSTFTDFPS